VAEASAAQGRGRGLALGAIAVVAVGVGLALAKEVLVPIAIALLLYALLRPLVRRMQRLRIPPTVSAVLVVLGLLGLLFGIGAAFSQPLGEWAQRAPKTIEMARGKISKLTASLPFGGGGAAAGAGGSAAAPSASGGSGGAAQPGNAHEATDGSTAGSGDRRGASPQAGGQASTGGGARGGSGGTSSSGSGGGAGGQEKGGGSSPLTSILGRVFGTTASLITGAIETLLLLAFLLAAGDRLRTKVRCAIRGEGDRERAVRIAEDIEAVVSRYVVATALINVGQGVAVGLAMWAIGLPTPALWGLMTVVVEFVPYLGALVMVVLLAVAGLATFGDLGHALLGPGAYLAISTLQNNLVSPVAYGRGLKLSPAVILVAVMVWYFLWGVAGAFVAVPVVAALKVLTNHVPSLKRFSDLLAD
jgi:predicted PurR-regulated permease PerM